MYKGSCMPDGGKDTEDALVEWPESVEGLQVVAAEVVRRRIDGGCIRRNIQSRICVEQERLRRL